MLARAQDAEATEALSGRSIEAHVKQAGSNLDLDLDRGQPGPQRSAMAYGRGRLAGACGPSTSRVGRRSSTPLLLVAALAAVLVLLVGAPSGAAAKVLPPAKELTLCLISGPPELSQALGQATVQPDEVMSLAQATQRLHGLSIDMVNAVFNQILKWPVVVKYVTGFSKTLYETRVGDG